MPRPSAAKVSGSHSSVVPSARLIARSPRWGEPSQYTCSSLKSYFGCFAVASAHATWHNAADGRFDCTDFSTLPRNSLAPHKVHHRATPGWLSSSRLLFPYAVCFLAALRAASRLSKSSSPLPPSAKQQHRSSCTTKLKDLYVKFSKRGVQETLIRL